MLGLMRADDGFEPVLQRAADREEPARRHRSDG
jgi:hypothetical protein